MSGFIKLLTNKWYPPAPCTETFSGKTVLITGTTGGLGFEAAKKLVSLNTSTLIITGRSISRAEDAKTKIQDWVKSTSSTSNTRIIPLALDMSSHTDIETFLQDLSKTTQQLDSVILNAGTTQPTYEASPDGYELTLQVNTISTIYLGICLLPYLRKSYLTTNQPAHLTFISSGTATRISPSFVSQYHSEVAPLAKLSEPNELTPGIGGAQARYGQSKLLLEYALRRLASSLSGTNGDPGIIVNSVCPGMCQSDLGRHFQGPGIALVKWIIYTFFARTADQGANAYLTGVTQGAEAHGRLWRHDIFHPDDEENWPVIASKEGREFGDAVWKEMQEIIEKWDKDVLKNLS